MEYSDLIKVRKSNRSYMPDAISDDIMKKLYKSLQVAPSGSNKQKYKFIFVTDYDLRTEVTQKACHQEFIGEAPVIMVATCTKGTEFDVAIAVDQMILKATDLGLGTCWIGWFERDIARGIFNIPDDLSIPIMVTIGYPKDEPNVKPRPRKSIDELVCFNQYKK